jgi:hypothetical protein
MGRPITCRHNGSTQWLLPDTAYVLEENSLPLLTDF